MYKVVLFQRVSTNQQDTLRQNMQLINQVHADGYKDEEVYVINYKESGVKLSYEQRRGLQELEQVIEQYPSIEIVYAHEISRLARRQDVTFSVIRKLTDKGICLHIQTPQVIRTLNPDGTENAIANLVISFLSYFAGEEAKQLKMRTKTGKEVIKAKGEVYGGQAHFGYKIVDRKIEVEPNDAAIVKKIFDDFLINDLSTVEIFKKYYDMGALTRTKVSNVHGGHSYILRILRDKSYCGKNDFYAYPPILSEETIDEAIEKLSSRKHKKRATKNVYYCRGLLKVNHEGKTYTLSPRADNASYFVTTYDYLDGNGSDRYTVNANIADTIAKNQALLIYSIFSAYKNKTDKEATIARLHEIDTEIAGYEKSLKALDAEFERVMKMYRRGIIELEELDASKKMTDNQTVILKKKIEQVSMEKANITAMLSNEQTYDVTVEELFMRSEPEAIADIVSKMIDRIEITRLKHTLFNLSVYPKVECQYEQDGTMISLTKEPTVYVYRPYSKKYQLSRLINGEELPYDGVIEQRHKATPRKR